MPNVRPPRATPTAAWRAVRQMVGDSAWPRIREIATSTVIVITLAIGVVWNSPDAAITRTVLPLLRPIALAVGLDQNWSMYAPNPPRRQENIEVRISMADGSERVWTLPRLQPVFGVAFSHRWRKLKETLLDEPQTRPEFVHWVVREMSRPGDRPLRVDMLLRGQDIPPPGAGRAGHVILERLYTEDLAGNR